MHSWLLCWPQTPLSVLKSAPLTWPKPPLSALKSAPLTWLQSLNCALLTWPPLSVLKSTLLTWPKPHLQCALYLADIEVLAEEHICRVAGLVMARQRAGVL